MANAYVVKLGDMVSYLAPASGAIVPRWRAAKVTSITDQNNLGLAVVNSDSTRIALNGGTDVARRTTGTQTNVWRPYT